MSFADRSDLFTHRLNDWPSRYGLAIAAVFAAAYARHGLVVVLGFTHSFVLFYPTILGVALLAGFGPALFATLLSAATADFFFASPVYSFKFLQMRDGITLLLFVLVGVAISWVAESTRRRSEKLREFERAIEGVQDMIAVVDRDYRYLVANRAFLAHRGMKKEDVLGRRVSEVLNVGVFQSQIKEKLDECFAGKVVRYEMKYSYPELGERELLIRYLPIKGSKGIDRAVTVIQDITEIREADRSLRLFRTLIDHSNDAVVVVDPETMRFLDVNDRACRDLGYTRDELLTMKVTDIDPAVDEYCQAETSAKLLAGESVLRETMHRRKDGSRFPVEVSLSWVEVDRNYVI